MRWMFPLLIGVTTACVAFIINLCVENIAGYKFEIAVSLNDTSTALSFFVYLMFDVGLTIIATFLTTFVAPPAAGSGIPDVKVQPHQEFTFSVECRLGVFEWG
jgi:chloride channel 7